MHSRPPWATRRSRIFFHVSQVGLCYASGDSLGQVIRTKFVISVMPRNFFDKVDFPVYIHAPRRYRY